MSEEKNFKEALEWVKMNKGFKVGLEGRYGSPRISSEFMDCSMLFTFDQYNYCSLGCLYCFAYCFKSVNPEYINKDEASGTLGLRKINAEKMIRAIQGDFPDDPYYINFYKRKFILHWGGLADPFCNFEKANSTGYELIEELAKLKYPVVFSLKGAAVLGKKYLSLFEKYAHQKNFAFQFSIINFDSVVAKKVEVGVPVPAKRIEAMKILSQMGYWTVLRLRPYIIGITELSLDPLLEGCLAAGVNSISTEFLALSLAMPLKVKERHDLIASLIGLEGGKKMYKHFIALSPPTRKNNLRLNRLIKEPHVKKLYKFCIDNNLHFACSDPDYKELNMSGNCCGLPENYGGNNSLNNWSRFQLTEQLVRARREYHLTGESKEIRFNETYPVESTAYLDDNRLGGDNPRVISLCQGNRNVETLRKIANRSWNNLKSEANPYNYLDGKIYPSSIDKDGDIVYKYSPHEYESRWREEGILLTR